MDRLLLRSLRKSVFSTSVLAPCSALWIVGCGNAGLAPVDPLPKDASSSVEAGPDTPDPEVGPEAYPDNSLVPEADAEAGSPFDNIQVAWSPCSLVEGEDDGLAECSSTQMPLFWDKPDGRTIEIRAKRLKAAGEAHTQLWLLHGGPGASGVVGFPPRMKKWHDLDPGLEIYTLDHRGTGFSSRLGCAEAEASSSPGGTSITSAETPACVEALTAEFGDKLNALSTTNSAFDVAAYVHATREVGKKVIVYGASYGTYWAHRYLQVAPDQAQGVVIEGIAPADTTFIRFDERANQTGKDFLNVCAADSFCSSKLGPDPWKRLGTLLTNMQSAGHCSALKISRWDVSALLAYALYYYPTNSVVPAAIYRLERCTAKDRAAVASLFNFFFGTGGVWDINSYSILLQHHITFSELWYHTDFAGVDLEKYFQDIYDTAYVAKNNGALKLELSNTWPAYKDPTYDDKWATTSTPLLMMQGRLDPATSWIDASSLKAHFNGPQQHYIEFPQAPHGTTGATPLSSGAGAEHCALQLFRSFLSDPTAELDTSCVAKVLPIDFKGTTELSQATFGTDDFWEDPTPPTSLHKSNKYSPEEALQLRKQLQQSLREQAASWPAGPSR